VKRSFVMEWERIGEGVKRKKQSNLDMAAEEQRVTVGHPVKK
jgi:hypothetical protein